MLEGAMEPKAIAAQAKRLDFPAAALTDRNGLYAVMPFSDACIAEGVQPIVGALLGVARPGMPEGKGPLIDWLPLYAQDEAGYEICARSFPRRISAARSRSRRMSCSRRSRGGPTA